MEPLAPGTEDDPICNPEFKPTKKDAAEEEASSKKTFLPDGTYGNIFLLEYVQGAQHWFCRVCDKRVFGRVFNHELGKKHLSRLRYGKNDDVPEGDDDEKTDADTGLGMVVAPGEPLPPGFEGEQEATQTQIQERLDKFNAAPLVGLEYLLESSDYDPSKEPVYMCVLCHKKGDPRTILTHLASYNHQITYLQKHFPTAYRHIAPFMTKVYKRNWQSGLQKICEAIESTFGRLQPIQVDSTKYNKNTMHYIELVAKGKHFSELSGHTFENVVTREDLTKVHEEPKTHPMVGKRRKSPSPPVVAKPIKRLKPQIENIRKRSLSPVSDVSSSDLEDFDPRSPKRNIKSNDNFRKDRPGNDKGALSRKEGYLPWQKASYRKDRPQITERNIKDDRSDKMDEFKRLAKAIDNQMELVLKKHKENPEKHPKYNDEWKKFWNARYKELQAEGKNAATHDFKPEWIEFWNKRMLELHQEEVRTSKLALRKRLGSGEEPSPICFKIGERRKLGSGNKPVPTAAQPDNDPEVIVIEDNEEDGVSFKRGTNRSRSPFKKKEQFRRRSPGKMNASPPSRDKKNSLSPIGSHRRRNSSPPLRRDSPLSRREDSPISRRPSPPTLRIKDSAKLQSSPSSRRRNSSPLQRAPSPPSRFKDERKRSPSPSRDRSPRRDKYDRLRDSSDDRSRSRGKSRETSWERERERRRDYDDKHWERPYRTRDPWELDLLYPKDPYAPPKVLRDVTRKPVLERQIEIPEDDGEVNIVAILRLLTASEEKLGSLGPKIIDLLAQALAMEKKLANSSENLLDSEINCVLFETVKEKLKGQLQAGLVDWVQEKVFKDAIKKTASLIHIAGERKKQKEQELPKKPVVVPGIGKVDKGKIARQIANALIAQGKTDVTQSELEELINAVVGIAEAQKNTSETLTTATFLEKFAGSQSTEIKKDNPKEDPKPIEKKEKVTVNQKMEEDQDASSSSQDKSTINMEGLSDSDLETLSQNFKDLSNDEQLGLINYLKKLEAKEPERVEKLRKFVNLSENNEEKNDSGKYSPFSAKMEESSSKKDEPEKAPEQSKEDNSGFVNIDSDEEYSFEDVAKAVSQKVIENEKEQKRMEDKNLEDKNSDDAKAFITSSMSSSNKNVPSSAGSMSATPSVSTVSKSPPEKINIISNIPVSSVDIAKSSSGITMSVSSLGNILGNVKNLSHIRNQAEQPQQEPKSNINPQSFPDHSKVPSGPSSIPRNTYNDFDIGIQRDMKNPGEYNSQGFNRGRQNKPYDEFNIEPICRDVKDDTRSLGPSNRMPEKEFPDMRPSVNSPFPDRSYQLEANLPYSNVQGADRSHQLEANKPYSNVQGAPFRGNIHERPLQTFPNQYPQRGMPFPSKARPVDNFESNVGRGDFRMRGDDFRGGNSDLRGPMGNFRTEYREGPDDFRDGQPNYRGNDFREMRGHQGNNQGPVDEMRNKGDEFGGNFNFPRGGQPFKGGNFNHPNRQNNFPPAPRHPGNNNYNPHNRW